MVIFASIAAFIAGIVGGFYLRGYVEGDEIGSLRDALDSAYTEIESYENKIAELVAEKTKPKKPKTKAT